MTDGQAEGQGGRALVTATHPVGPGRASYPSMAPKLAALTLMGLLIARGADDAADAVAVASREQDVESGVSYGCFGVVENESQTKLSQAVSSIFAAVVLGWV